jgi:hypothetical protein
MLLCLAAALVFQSAQLESILWTDPGPIESIDFTMGAGGAAKAPRPPFTFVSEDSGGTSPKVIVKDAAGIEWRVKGGLEVRAESFVTRVVTALGYYAESTWFMAKGRIENVTGLTRAGGFVSPDGSFTYASFERRDPELKFSKQSWLWNASPFNGSRELNGLKVLMMLFSNWDNKDARDSYRGSNTGVLESADGKRLIYFVNDWGQTMGSWGHMFGRSSWNCAGYEAQSSQFVQGVSGGAVQFGYRGQHTWDFRRGIPVEHVRWLMQYLRRVTDAQIHVGLLASGASAGEEACFSKAIRARIGQLRAVSEQSR